MYSLVHAAQPELLRGGVVRIETDVSRGLYSFTIVGLPDKAVEEARDRVLSAIKNSGFDSPTKRNHKIVASLAPADTKKEGAYFDLPLAVGYLSAIEEIPKIESDSIFIGELSLSGETRPVRGALALAETAKKEGFKNIFISIDSAREAALVDGISVFGIKNLTELIKHLKGEEALSALPTTEINFSESESDTDFSFIEGQNNAKRALMIAAAGGHNIALSGPPGTGKTLLARALSSILPPLSREEALEVTAIHSIVGSIKNDFLSHPPVRSPHHTSSYVAVIGGGANPRPGEVTLSHRGVLFLDEFPEFDKRVIESLRQPLEDRFVSISRARGSAIFPASFILVAAMNPCPCGFRGSKDKSCTCRAMDLEKYERKLSGPIVDRIDLFVDVPTVSFETLSGRKVEEKESSKDIREKVVRARRFAKKRFAGTPIKLNSEMSSKNIHSLARASDDALKTLEEAGRNLNLSGRSFHRIIKLARTIADLRESEYIESEDILTAIQYRKKES